MGRAVVRFVLALVLAQPSWTFAEVQVQGSPRVRASSPEIAEAIEQAHLRSPTFRDVVAAISRTDGIVYVHQGQCGRNVLACLLLAVTQAGPNRILHDRHRVEDRQGTAPVEEATLVRWSDSRRCRHAVIEPRACASPLSGHRRARY